MIPDTCLFTAALSLAESAAENQRLFLLADQSALPRIASLWPLIAGQPWASLMPSGADQPDGATPLLIDISDIRTAHRPRRVLNALYEHGRHANCLSLITSSLAFGHLVEAMTLRTQAELPDRLNVRLRYFDTRTLPLLPQLLRPEQYAAFMQCAASWHYVDRHGKLQRLPPPAVTDTQVDASQLPLVFDTAQETQLIEDGTADAVIDQLLDQRHPAFAGTTPAQQFALISPLVDAARTFGIVEVNDVLLYCCTALRQGPGFEIRPPWAERLTQHRQGTLTLMEALGDEAS